MSDTGTFGFQQAMSCRIAVNALKLGDRDTEEMDAFRIAELRRFARCFFILRSDYTSKSGGDVDLARQISAELNRVGGVSVLTTADELSGVTTADCLFLFNIDRPFDAALALSRVPEDTTCFLYTLHHPRAGVTQYLRALTGPRGCIAAIAGHRPQRYEMLVDIAKGMRSGNPRRIGTAMSHGRAVRDLLARCRLLVVSSSELAEIERTFGMPACGAMLLPHPVAPAAEAAAMPFRHVLIAGRIEPRKNQLRAIEALARSGIRERGFELLVIGGPGSDDAYFRATLEACRKVRAIYLSHLPGNLFFPVVSSASLLVNPSFFEVTSLIDLYAIRKRVPLITTCHAYYEPAPGIVRLDPTAWAEDDIAIREAIERLLPTPGAEAPF